MTTVYEVGRDVTEELGNIYHVYMGAQQAALKAASHANAARAEYEIQLRKLMAQYGVLEDRAPYVRVEWHTGRLLVEDSVVAGTI